MNKKGKVSLWKKLLVIIFIIFVLIKGWDMLMTKKDSNLETSYLTKKLELEGMDIYYDDMGSGSPTIVLLSGSGVASTYTDMYSLWSRLKDNHHVFMMDRPGMGKSSDTDRRRDIDSLTQELDLVLNKSNQEGPYLFVAHSMSGLQAIRYGQQYPEKTYGIVFVDAASPGFCKNFDDPMDSMVHVLKFARKSGILRVVSSIPGMRDIFNSKHNLPTDLKELEKAITLQRMWNPAMINERKEIKANGEKVSKEGNLGNIPIRVISAGNNGFDGWLDTQKELLELSTNSSSVILNEAGHFIHHESTEVVIKEIEDLLMSSDELDINE